MLRHTYCVPLFSVLLLAGTAPLAVAQTPTPKADTTSFVAPQFVKNMAGGSNLGVMMSGDLNGDSHPDLVTLMPPVNPGTFWPGGAEVWLNDGNGNFSVSDSFTWQTAFSSQTNFWIATNTGLEDATGDGQLDVIVDRKDLTTESHWDHVGPSGLLIFPGNGDGTFAPHVFLETEAIASNWQVGDADGDGHPDVFVHDSSGAGPFQRSVQWWTFDGSDFVELGPLLDLGNGGYSRAASLRADADSDVDVAAFQQDFNLRILLSDGGSPILGQVIAIPPELQNVNRRVYVDDLDGDGTDDMFLVHEVNDFGYLLSILQPSPGTFIPQPVQVIPQETFKQKVSVFGSLVDWDDDGDPDYVSSVFSWLENQGDGTFVYRTRAPWIGSASGNYTRVLTDDFNGDGHVDAMYGWMLFEGNGSVPRRTAHVHEFLNLIGSPMDWEGDGDVDTVSNTTLHLNRGDGSFDMHSRPLPYVPDESFEWAGLGDFDGDGFRDAVVAAFSFVDFHTPPNYEGMRLYTSDANGDYTQSVTVPSLVRIEGYDAATPWPAGDPDGDGDLDILDRDGFWENDGTGVFGSPIAAYSGRVLHALDFDGDGQDDLLMRNSGQIEMLINQGGTNFAVQTLSSAGSGIRATFADVDADGDLDLIRHNIGGPNVRVNRQLANGLLDSAVTISIASGAGENVGVDDLNGDGRLDLLVGQTMTVGTNDVPVVTGLIRGPGSELDYSERRFWIMRYAVESFFDVEGDGDVDAYGTIAFENRHFDGRRDGQAVQYRVDYGGPGTGDATPVLGLDGPVRPGAAPQLRVARGLGGASGWLVTGTDRSFVPSATFAGVTSFVEPMLSVDPIQLDGDVGLAGAGTLEIPLPPALPGTLLTYQVVLVDPVPTSGFSWSNGLEVLYGFGPTGGTFQEVRGRSAR